MNTSRKIVQKLFKNCSLFNVQLSLEKQKKRRFRWERTIETAFRAYERSGRGREIYKLYKPIRRDRPIGYVLAPQKISPNRLEAGILLSHNNMSVLGRQKS